MDTTVGICMVRDAQDIIGATVANALAHCDHVVVVDNLSTDGTTAILTRMVAERDRLTVLVDSDPAYNQDAKMTKLAAMAHGEFGAEFIVPFDADEMWHVRTGGRIADALAALDPAVNVVEATLYDYVATGADGQESNPVERLQWRRAQHGPFPKVAVRYRDDLHIQMGNHGADYSGVTIKGRPGVLTVRHFPYRSPSQMIHKVRVGAHAISLTDMPHSTCQHWRDYDKLSDVEIRDVFTEHFYVAHPEVDDSLIYDPAPVWQFG